MVHFSKKVLLILLLIVSIIVSISHSYSATSYLTLSPTSSSSDVTKIQTLFKTLSIYAGEADGNYSSIKSDIIAFQINKNVIDNKDSDGAGYIGPKTYTALTDFYGNEFTEAYSEVFDIQITAEGDEEYFVVSAYYSPLTGQKRYATGSYAGDIRLNGNGTHGASGEAVHPGFIAAPSSYPFGTKIYIEGLGVGTVEDRGGAIVQAGVRGHEYDRLDIWMGYGDDGLTRALNWGKVTVAGKIMPTDSENTIEYSGDKGSVSNNLAIKIDPNSGSESITTMQTYFNQAGIYSGEIDGKYSSFKESIIDFQIGNDIISTRTSSGNGYIGTKTIVKLEEVYPEIFLADQRKTEEEIQEINQEIESEPDIRFQVTVSDNVTKKYNITDTQKRQIDAINIALIEALEKKYPNDNLKLKTQKNKMAAKILALVDKVESETLKIKLQYLYDEFTSTI